MGSTGSEIEALPVLSASVRPRIHLLPDAVKSRIAAGEVIERPASVLKELVENALDAGAKAIHVLLEAGGRELIRVTDDGSGMTPEELVLSIQRHATSKLTSADDLYRLTTLGFRGEALPSIGSVSRMTISTRPRLAAGAGDSDAAWRLRVEGGAVGAPEPAAGGFGTTVEVRELFFNLPARKKFLKGPGAEAAACGDTLLRLALVRPDVAFTLLQGRQEILACPATAAPAGTGHVALAAYAQRAEAALGQHLAHTLVQVAAEGPGERPELAAGAEPAASAPQGYRLFGLVTPPAQTRPNRAHIYLAVNGRPVKDRTLTTALLEAFRHLLPPKRYPAAVLFLDLPGSDVDINVHPTKAEVRFRIPGLVFSLFHHALREAFAPQLQVASHASRVAGPTLVSPADAALETQDSGLATRRFDLWQGERAVPGAAAPGSPAPRSHAPLYPGAGGASTAAEAPAAHLGLRVAGARLEDAPRPSAEIQNSKFKIQHFPSSFRVLGQAGGAYIVAEDERGVLLFDQHALHERVLFEELLARARAGTEGSAGAERQGLLLPEILELSPAQAAAFSDPEAREVLAELGYEVAEFGPRAIAVHAVPVVLKGARAASLVREVLEALAQVSEEYPAGKKRPDRASLREKAAYVLSCKGAIKAGEQLSPEQAQALLAEFQARVGGRSFTCPHGRPLAIELSWEELERRVGRT